MAERSRRLNGIDPNKQNCSAFPLFDSHFHIIDRRFPLTPNNGYLPDDLTCSDYRVQMSAYDLRGGAIVSGSFQAFDQSYLLDALHTLGPLFVGVTQLPATVTDREILDLDGAGVRAVRFNLKRGGSEDVRHRESTYSSTCQPASSCTRRAMDSRCRTFSDPPRLRLKRTARTPAPSRSRISRSETVAGSWATPTKSGPRVCRASSR